MENETKTPGSAFRFSRFGSVRSKCAVDTTLAQFVDEIRSDVHRAKVEEYRRLKAQPGHEAEAKRIKDNLPCVTPSAVCFGGHAVSDLRTYSGLLCVDLDHTDSRTDDICRLAAALPYVAVVFRSVSGCGVKIFVHIRPDDLSGGFAQWAVISFIVHGLEGLVMALIIRHVKRRGLAKLIAFLWCILIVPIGYYVLSGAILVGFEAALADLPGNFIQSTVGAVLGFALSEAVKKAYPPVVNMGW